MGARKVFAALFVGVFLLLCLIPGAGMLLRPASETVGNEHLAPLPAARTETGTFNTAYLSELSDYISDHFFLRHALATANAGLLGRCFGVTGSETVLSGTDGWLYYAETVDDYTGLRRMSDREIFAAAHTLSMIREYCEARGASFCFTIAPNKVSLYPEHLPRRFSPASPTDAERLVKALAAEHVRYADLFDAFRSQDEVLYYRTDSHWNDRGAALAADTILHAMGKDAQPFFEGAYSVSAEHTGDLYRMVYPLGTLTEPNAVYERSFAAAYDARFRTVEDITIFMTNPNGEGGLLLFRDSFGNAMHPYLADPFAAACISRSMPYSMAALEREGATDVVIEIVERNLNWLCSRAPIMPAPIREVIVPEAENTKPYQAICEPCMELGGYTRITGTLPVKPDASSQIYCKVGDVVYEAFPAGEGEKPFSLLIPSDIFTDDAAVSVRTNGQLKTFTYQLLEHQ